MYNRKYLPVNIVIKLLILLLMIGSSLTQLNGETCSSNKLAVYRLHLNTTWTREKFPKQYPEFRPPAQWSKIVGNSHNKSFNLFKIGKTASEGLKKFAELGISDGLEKETQQKGFYDEFSAPAMRNGAGKAETKFFVDGKHSMVSLVSKIIPSPDWFIGIDSLDLCIEGRWIDYIKLELSPLDAGTDNGFTFTSPNWPTTPQKPISRITARDPSHPANSFYYDDRSENPPIATAYIIKTKEYELSRVYNHEFPAKREKNLKNSFPETIVERIRHRKGVVQGSYGKSIRVPAYSKQSSDDNLISSLMTKYARKYKTAERKTKKKRSRKYRKARDCIVGEWSAWSACSKTCGIGEQMRRRKVAKHSRRGGRPCPVLKEQKWCGSASNCAHKYFNW